MSTAALLYCAGGGIGDSLVASVVARALRKRYDRVDALTLPGHRATLERCADVDAVLVDDGETVDELAKAVGERGYRACVVTWATARAARVARTAGIPLRIGQARRLYSTMFTNRVLVRSEFGDVTSHWSDILLDYARAIDCDTAERIPSFVPTAADRDEAGALLGTIPAPFLILHPTNAIAPRRGNWPVHGWSALASALRERFDAAVLISGSDADREITAQIEQAARDGQSPQAQSRIMDIAGRLSIGGFGALAQRAKAFVGITTGSMHVAAAVGAPTVGIFPFQTDFPDRWAPLGHRTGVVRASFPCHRGDTKESCPDYACIEKLDVPRIVAAVSAII